MSNELTDNEISAFLKSVYPHVSPTIRGQVSPCNRITLRAGELYESICPVTNELADNEDIFIFVIGLPTFFTNHSRASFPVQPYYSKSRAALRVISRKKSDNLYTRGKPSTMFTARGTRRAFPLTRFRTASKISPVALDGSSR